MKISVRADGEEVVITAVGSLPETRLTLEEAEKFEDELYDALGSGQGGGSSAG